ncbi:MAG: hypothetical protein AAFN08_12005 [Cyanobacteria bacterium J06559_3]
MKIGQFLLGAGTLLLPLALALFKREIGSLYQSWAIYNSRPFDQDRKPDTPDRCQLYNSSTGKWEDILIEKYEFSWKQDQRGVFVCHPVAIADGSIQWAKERIPFDVWATMRKRTMPEPESKSLSEPNRVDD